MKKSLALNVPVLIVLSIAASASLRSQSSLIISGRTSDADTNAPIAGLALIAVRAPDLIAARPVVFRTTSDASGGFAVPVTPGKYRICAEEGHMYLDPCQWPSPAGTPVNVTTAAHLDLALKRGVFLKVHFHDPVGTVARIRATDSAIAKLPGPPVTVSFTDTSGILRIVPFEAVVAGISQFKVLVPQSSSIVLALRGSKLLLADSTGKVVTPGSYSLPLTIPAVSAFLVPAQASVGFFRKPLIPSVDVHFTITGASP